MTVLTRVSRLIKADLHAMLDCLEEPEVMLQQALRDMEAELTEIKHNIEGNQRVLQESQRMAGRLDGQIKQLEKELELCLAHNNDDLARPLLRKKLQMEKQLLRLEHSIASLDERIQKQQETRQQQEAIFCELQQRAQCFNQQASTEQAETQFCEFNVTDADVELALLKAKSKGVQREN